ncbi:hypothetical protein FYJ26_06980 [Anaerococcus sp. WCA-380-WT-2B]|uniref:Zn-finger containing protein n=1 Tax=Anaerococcus porci TaxID=2652269 RepID=A0A6N7VTF0_9FIRM|nr:hypothetical protein [Anaerococcus porci]
MKKRHGIDELSIALVWQAILFLVINFFVKETFLNIFASIIFVYAIFRTLSLNDLQRNSENYIFKLKILNPIQKKYRYLKRKMFGNSEYKYIKCKSCKQELRIPKGKGKIIVKCPKCKTKQKVKS